MYSYTTTGKELWITLAEGDHINKLHTCGDVIRGQLHYRPLSTKPIDRLAIHFKCKHKTQITTGSGENRRTYKAKAILLWEVRDFITTTTTFPAVQFGQNHTVYDFEFKFPWRAGNFYSTKNWGTNVEFESQPGGILPPSFLNNYAGDPQSVRYYLEAKLHKPNVLFKSNVKDSLPLLFSPPRGILTPDLQPATVNLDVTRMSRWLDPKLRYEKVPFGKKMKRVFGVVEEVDPHVSFNVTASVPTVLTTTSTIPIPFTITFDPGRSETPEVPRVELVSVHARLTMYSAYRVPTRMAWKGGELIRHSERKLDVAKVHLHPMRYPEIHPVTGLPHSNYGANEVSGVDASSSEVSGMNSSTSNEVTGLDTNLSSTRQDIKPPAFPHDLKPPISHNDEASSSSSLPTPSTSSSSQTYDLSHLLPGLLLTGQISPAFRTYGLNISYKLKISIELKCAEKVSEHLIANHALSVWPCLFREWDEGAESTARLAVPVLTGEMGRLEINGEELPSYGDVEAGGMGNKKDIGREKEADLMGGKISKDEEARLERERNKERAGDGNGNGKGKDALPPYKETDDWKNLKYRGFAGIPSK